MNFFIMHSGFGYHSAFHVTCLGLVMLKKDLIIVLPVSGDIVLVKGHNL